MKEYIEYVWSDEKQAFVFVPTMQDNIGLQYNYGVEFDTEEEAQKFLNRDNLKDPKEFLVVKFN